MNKPFLMPTNYFAMPLGLGALAMAWFHAAAIFPEAAMVGNVIGIVAVIAWCIFIGLYGYKLLGYFEQVKDEWQCPVHFSFLALIPITTMLVGDLFYHWQFAVLGESLVWLGVIGQLVYATLRIGVLWQGDTFSQEAVLPPFYLPSVASNFTAASSLALLGYTDFAYLFLGAGMIAWIMFEPVLLQRLRTLPVPDALKASLGIVLAPAFVGVSAYLSINGGQVDTFAKFLWGYGFLQLLFLARMLPSIARNGFSLGFWAFSFGLASMANSAVAFYAGSQLGQFAMGVFIFANLMMALLALNTLAKLIKGQFWLK